MANVFGSSILINSHALQLPELNQNGTLNLSGYICGLGAIVTLVLAKILHLHLKA